jgi:hypothetical protein
MGWGSQVQCDMSTGTRIYTERASNRVSDEGRDGRRERGKEGERRRTFSNRGQSCKEVIRNEEKEAVRWKRSRW